MCRYDVKKVKNIEATLLLGITILIEWCGVAILKNENVGER